MSSAKEPVTRRFGNGLTVLIKEDKSHPVVSLQYWVGTGSMNEGHWQGSGLSHLLEHLVFKGTAHFSGQELARKVQERGGHWNAYTSVNRTVYYIDGPAESWQIFLNLLTGNLLLWKRARPRPLDLIRPAECGRRRWCAGKWPCMRMIPIPWPTSF